MKIIRPYATLLKPWAIQGSNLSPATTGILALQFIEWCGRISHRSEETQTEESWKRFIESVVSKHGDWSIVEHVTASVDSITDRGITHESVRHRLFSFTQESTRFVNYEKKMPPAFIYPKVEVECGLCLDGDADLRGIHPQAPYWTHSWMIEEGHRSAPCVYEPEWLSAITVAEKQYIKLLAKGWRPQEARSVFPNALASRIITTGNLRNWRHFFIMRTSLETHPQMKQVTFPLLKQFQETFPLLFDDIVPLLTQAEALKKAR